MHTQPDGQIKVTRYLRALGFALTSAFTTIAEDFDRLMRWCCCGSALRLAVAG